LKKTDHEIRARYSELGKQRFKEGIPFAEVLWALVLTEDHLRERMGNSISAGSAVELHQEQGIYRLIGRFFDRAVCYAVHPSGLRHEPDTRESPWSVSIPEEPTLEGEF
jgi:hypothetical protein